MPIAYEFRPDFVLGERLDVFAYDVVGRTVLILCVTQCPLALMLRKETSWADVTSPQVDMPR